MHTLENEMLFSLAERGKQEREKVEFDEARKWLFEQDVWTQDLFRQSLTSLLLKNSTGKELELEKGDLELFDSILDKMKLSEETKLRMLKTFKEVGRSLFGDYAIGFLGDIKSFEELVISEQNAERIPKSIDPKEAAKKLALIQAHPNKDDLHKLLIDLNISPNFKFLSLNIDEMPVSLKSAIEQLFFLGDFAQRVFFKKNETLKMFTDEEIEEIKKGIARLEERAKKRGVEPL